LLFQSFDMADGDAVLPTLRDVLLTTRFGQAMLARCGLAVLAGPVLEVPLPARVARARWAAALAGAAVATLAATGHGAAA
ncbi:hypothetical protein, partial [Staphylococcus aureus]